MNDFDSYFRQARASLTDLSTSTGSPFSQERDPDFWANVDHIGQAGRTREANSARWLANFTQFDEFDDDGKRYILAAMALEALAQMPEASLQVGRDLLMSLPENASSYRVIGACKVLEKSRSLEAVSLINPLLARAKGRVLQDIEQVVANLTETN